MIRSAVFACLALFALQMPAEAAALRTVITCARSDHRNSLQIGIVRENAPSAFAMLVVANGRLIYRKRVVVQAGPTLDRIHYLSGSFTNANDAPSSLQLLVYREAGLQKGQWSEVSYLPVLPREISEPLSWGMACRQNSSIRF
jgi:hypothetical protein